MRKVNVKFSLEGVIREDKDTASFVAYCPALDLYSAAKTRPEARRAMQSAVDMYVRICYERNILGRLLHEKGFLPAPAALVGDLADHGGAYDANFIAVEETTHQAAYDDIFPIEVPLNLIAGQHAAGMAGACLQQ